MVKILIILILFLSWFIFSGHKENFYIISGIISSFIVFILCLEMGVFRHPGSRFKLNIKIISYPFWLIKEIAVSSYDVAIRVFKSNEEIDSVMEWVPVVHNTDLLKTIYATSITLTPGTICIEVNKDKALVHALTKDNLKGLIEGPMANKINEM